MTNIINTIKYLMGRTQSGWGKTNGFGHILWTIFFTTDVERWKINSTQIPGWDERNKIIAKIIPKNNSVIDVGAGAQTLRKHLKSGCAYQPCDIVKSSEDTLVCDFNRGLYPAVNKKYDYVVCSGVLEYIRSPKEFLERIACYGNQMIISYAINLPEKSFKNRLKDGWVNHFSRDELENLFGSLNLKWEFVSSWNNQIIWKAWHHKNY